MTALASIIRQHEPALQARYGDRLLPSMLKALRAIKDCRGEDAAHWLGACDDCDARIELPHSCGHRACPHCQYDTGERWLERQRERLLPVDYYMVTFTVPAALRALSFCHQRRVYNALLRCAWETLKTFARNDAKLQGDIGATAVLHTHNRRRDFHPHVHLVVPAGGVNLTHGLWRKASGKYLFNGRNLATVFRGKLLAALRAADLELPEVPMQWVANCKHVGSGEKALQYLSRYLYRGVLSERDIIDDVDGQIRFRYIDSKTRKPRIRRLAGADFLWLLLQHVLPRGFRRSRDYGLLHHRRAQLLARVQLMLGAIPRRPDAAVKKPPLCCRKCGGRMRIIAMLLPINWLEARLARQRHASATRSIVM
jgi:hypothetical protein